MTIGCTTPSIVTLASPPFGPTTVSHVTDVPLNENVTLSFLTDDSRRLPRNSESVGDFRPPAVGDRWVAVLNRTGSDRRTRTCCQQRRRCYRGRQPPPYPHLALPLKPGRGYQPSCAQSTIRTATPRPHIRSRRCTSCTGLPSGSAAHDVLRVDVDLRAPEHGVRPRATRSARRRTPAARPPPHRAGRARSACARRGRRSARCAGARERSASAAGSRP